MRASRSRLSFSLPFALASATSLLGGATALSCNSVLGFGSYTISNDAGDATADAKGDTASNPADAGVDGCPTPTDKQELENACTSAACQPFTGVSPEGGLQSLPPVAPPPEGGSSASVDASSGGGSDASSPEDAGDESGTTGTLCSTLSNPVYATGSSALSLFLGTVGGALSSSLTFIYQTSSSCVGVADIISGTAITGTADYYDITGAAHSCTLPAGGVPVDIGISDVFDTTCTPFPNGPPPNLKENLGPVQTMAFAVPTASTQSAISFEAAYYVFGFGAAAGAPSVSPWSNPDLIFQRSSTSGTQNMIGATINVPAAQFQGLKNSSTGAMESALETADQGTNPSQAIGILATDYAETYPPYIRLIAFQDRGQTCGYYPDSTAAANDKANVRDGHYPIWGPSHFYTLVDGSGNPINQKAQTYIDSLSGLAPLTGVDLIQLYAHYHVVPLCAMHVQRSGDGGDYTPYLPPETCDCYYDLQATGSTTCQSCTSSETCPASAPVCRQFGNPAVGYCELQ